MAFRDKNRPLSDIMKHNRLSKKETRGRKKIVVPKYEGALFVMNKTTFVQIPESFKRGIYDAYKSGEIERPEHNELFEEIFYKSLAQREVVTIKKWISFLQKGGGKLLRANPEEAAKELGIEHRAEEYLTILSDCEMQRWYEWYYLSMIRKHGKCFTEYNFYDPDIVLQVATKYGLTDFPCAISMEDLEKHHASGIDDLNTSYIEGEGEPIIPKKRGSRLGEPKTKIDVSKISDLRLSLMKCKTAKIIAGEFKTSEPTIYNAIRANSFVNPSSIKDEKTIGQHISNITRLVSEGSVTWDRYVRIYAMCEKGFMKELYKANPSFVVTNKYSLVPTEESLTYDHHKAKGSLTTLAGMYGVPPNLMSDWISMRKIGSVEKLVKKKVFESKAPGIRDNVIDEEVLERLGIDNSVDPLAKDRKLKRDPDLYR